VDPNVTIPFFVLSDRWTSAMLHRGTGRDFFQTVTFRQIPSLCCLDDRRQTLYTRAFEE
jgi:hypothetical protein